MAATELQPGPAARSGPGYAYLMTGIALACICVSGVLGAIFTPQLVTGAQHQQTPVAAFTGWIFDLIAIGVVLTTATQGIRARASDRAPWTLLGLGVGSIWLAVMVVAVLSPTWVTGTDPTKLPIWAFVSAVAGIILTVVLCNFVKTASFQPAEPKAGTTAAPEAGREPGVEDEMVKLRRLAQLRDSGVISEEEFQTKKSDLLSRV